SVLYHDRVNAHRLREALEPGVLVLVHNATLDTLQGGKFLPRWTGPYRVKERLKKGSYLLEELDETPMKRVYAARRIRRYYPRGRKEEDIKKDELAGTDANHDNDIDNEEWKGNDEVPAEDLKEGDEIMTEILNNENAKIEAEIKKDRKHIFELPNDEESLKSAEVTPKEAVPSNNSEDTDNRDDDEDNDEDDEPDGNDRRRPARARLQPDWYVTGGWDALAKAKAAKAKIPPRVFRPPSSNEDEETDESTKRARTKAKGKGRAVSSDTDMNDASDDENRTTSRQKAKDHLEAPRRTLSTQGGNTRRKFWVEIVKPTGRGRTLPRIIPTK
ncbi:hypothetical protein P7C70_g9589, partial [Phenoliferia sp. Uapishka_3]